MTVPAYDADGIRLYCGDAREVMAAMEPESVSCCVTSPPYWGLRKYDGPSTIWGGDPACIHSWQEEPSAEGFTGRSRWQHKDKEGRADEGITRQSRPEAWAQIKQGATCSLCGAWRGQLGLEPTVEMFVAHTLEWMREVKRVLRKDGVFWLDIDDSRGGSGKGQMGDGSQGRAGPKQATNEGSVTGGLPVGRDIKPKSLALIPQRIALAAANDKEYIRFIKDERWAAWVAGIIDGEGYIGIQKMASGSTVYRPFISVKMTDSGPIEKLRALTGVGTVYTEKPTTENRRLVHAWRAQGEVAIQVLRDVYPWLVLKTRQAKIANALWDEKARKLEEEGRRASLSQAALAFRENLYQMIKGCNQREFAGDVDLPDLPQNFIDHSWIVRSQIILPTWMPESARDRPTDAYRTVLMLVRSPRYWYDGQAVRQPCANSTLADPRLATGRHTQSPYDPGYPGGDGEPSWYRSSKMFPQDGMRSLGNVWGDLPPSSSALPGEHFASFCIEQPERCIRASCPEAICVKCGKARARVVKTSGRPEHRAGVAYINPSRRDNDRPNGPELAAYKSEHPDETLGWTDCGCNVGWEPGVTLDPFVGTGTTAVAARKLGRRCIGIDVSEHYIAQAIKRLQVGDAGMRRMA